MQADINNYLFESPSDLEKKRKIDPYAVNGILTISKNIAVIQEVRDQMITITR